MANDRNNELAPCRECRMVTTPREYHPALACYLFNAGMSSDAVRNTLGQVIEYGMKAQRNRATLQEALTDITKVHK